MGGGVWPVSQNPLPIYDQNLRFSLRYLGPDKKIRYPIMTLTADTVALDVICLSVYGLIDNQEEVTSSKKQTQPIPYI